MQRQREREEARRQALRATREVAREMELERARAQSSTVGGARVAAERELQRARSGGLEDTMPMVVAWEMELERARAQSSTVGGARVAAERELQRARSGGLEDTMPSTPLAPWEPAAAPCLHLPARAASPTIPPATTALVWSDRPGSNPPAESATSRSALASQCAAWAEEERAFISDRRARDHARRQWTVQHPMKVSMASTWLHLAVPPTAAQPPMPPHPHHPHHPHHPRELHETTRKHQPRKPAVPRLVRR